LTFERRQSSRRRGELRHPRRIVPHDPCRHSPLHIQPLRHPRRLRAGYERSSHANNARSTAAVSFLFVRPFNPSITSAHAASANALALANTASRSVVRGEAASRRGPAESVVGDVATEPCIPTEAAGLVRPQFARTMFRSWLLTTPSPDGSPSKRLPGETDCPQLARTMFKSAEET
jgi:hypothetical protein